MTIAVAPLGEYCSPTPDDVHTMQPGKTLKLTIDAALQDEVEQVLAVGGASLP